MNKGIEMPHRLYAARDAAADIAATLSATGAVASWLNTANAVLQLLATAVALVAGLYAIKWHKARLRSLHDKVEEAHKAMKEVAKEAKDVKSE